MGALTDLWKSERGLVAIGALACITIMFGIGRLTSTEWTDSMKWILGIYISGKTASSITDSIMLPKAQLLARSTRLRNDPVVPPPPAP